MGINSSLFEQDDSNKYLLDLNKMTLLIDFLIPNFCKYCCGENNYEFILKGDLRVIKIDKYGMIEWNVNSHENIYISFMSNDKKLIIKSNDDMFNDLFVMELTRKGFGIDEIHSQVWYHLIMYIYLKMCGFNKSDFVCDVGPDNINRGRIRSTISIDDFSFGIETSPTTISHPKEYMLYWNGVDIIERPYKNGNFIFWNPIYSYFKDTNNMLDGWIWDYSKFRKLFPKLKKSKRIFIKKYIILNELLIPMELIRYIGLTSFKEEFGEMCVFT